MPIPERLKAWIDFVKAYQKKHGLSWRDALKQAAPEFKKKSGGSADADDEAPEQLEAAGTVKTSLALKPLGKVKSKTPKASKRVKSTSVSLAKTMMSFNEARGLLISGLPIEIIRSKPFETLVEKYDTDTYFSNELRNKSPTDLKRHVFSEVYKQTQDLIDINDAERKKLKDEIKTLGSASRNRAKVKEILDRLEKLEDELAELADVHSYTVAGLPEVLPHAVKSLDSEDEGFSKFKLAWEEAEKGGTTPEMFKEQVAKEIEELKKLNPDPEVANKVNIALRTFKGQVTRFKKITPAMINNLNLKVQDLLGVLMFERKHPVATPAPPASPAVSDDDGDDEEENDDTFYDPAPLATKPAAPTRSPDDDDDDAINKFMAEAEPGFKNGKLGKGAKDVAAAAGKFLKTRKPRAKSAVKLTVHKKK